MNKWLLFFGLLFWGSTCQLAAQSADEFYKAAAHNLNLGEKRLATQQLDQAVTHLRATDNDSLYTHIGELYLQLNRPKPVIRLLSPKLNARFAKAAHFVLLSKAYIKANKNDSARATAKEGLTLFPKSGALYRQLGITYSRELAFDKAATIWERGVAAEPNFAMNYYHLAKFYSQTSEQLWTILYGETYILLSEYSIMSRDIGRLVMAAYRQGIRVRNDSSRKVQLTTEGRMAMQGDDAVPNFPMAIQSNHAAAAAQVLKARGHSKPITVFELTDIRRQFLDYWYSQNLQQRFGSALFDYWQRLESAGLLEAYIIKELGYIDAHAHRELMTVNRRAIERYDTWRETSPFAVLPGMAVWNGRFSTP